MPSRISRALFAVLLLSPLARAADPTLTWKDPVTFEANVRSLPVELLPAIRFQRVYFRLSGSGAQLSDCAGEFQKLTAVSGEDHVSRTIAELSRIWLARIQIEEIDRVLRSYYRENVRFPETFDEIKRDLPKPLQVDPWGEPWVYHLAAPKGFSGMTAQRFQIGPKRYPNTSRLATALKDETKPDWQATIARSGDHRVLSLRSTSDASAAVIEPGGTFGGCTLLYAGENWALITTPDRLVALQF